MVMKLEQPALAPRDQPSQPNGDTSGRKRKVYIYIDHSNFFIEPYNRNNSQWKYNVKALKSLLFRHATINMDRRNFQPEFNVYGYIPDCLQKIWEQPGVTVHELRQADPTDVKNGIEKEKDEKEVDTSLVAHSVRQAVEAWYDEDPEAKSVFVIVSGDRDMRPAVEQIIDCERPVHVWAWNETVSKVYDVLHSGKSLVTLHRLDNYEHGFFQN